VPLATFLSATFYQLAAQALGALDS